MPFIVLDNTLTADRKVRYVQFGDECATLDEARKLARFPNMRKPIIVDLEKVARVPERFSPRGRVSAGQHSTPQAIAARRAFWYRTDFVNSSSPETKMATKKFTLAAAVILAMTVAFALPARPGYAATVDCAAVMNELNSGKHEKEVAADLSIALYQVRKCKRKAQAAAKAQTKTSLQARRGREVPVPPSPAMGSSSPVVVAPSAAASP